MSAGPGQSDAASPGGGASPSWRVQLLAVAGLVLLILGYVAPELVSGDAPVISSPIGDAVRYMIPARAFAAAQILDGNIPLWNPHQFSGTPFLASFQPAALYPFNVGYLLLPANVAANLEFCLSLLFMGTFTFAWARGRGLHPLAAFCSAALLVFGAPVALRVLAGQLTVLGVYAWAPLLFLSMDRIFQRPSLAWSLVGAFSVTMMILAGHPPTVLMTGLIAGLYAAIGLVRSRQRGRALAALALVAAAPVFLGAVQLWTGLAVATEASRSGVSYKYATSFSIRPEGLLGLVAPQFFGDVRPYWGRWWYWDDTIFMGAGGLLLAVYGATRGRHPLRVSALLMTLAAMLLALGRYTPLYAVLYELVPGFDWIRAPSKFAFYSMLFASLLAGIGLDRLLRGTRPPRALAAAALGAALLCVLAGVWLRAIPAEDPQVGVWRNPLLALDALREDPLREPRRYLAWAGFASRALLQTSVAVGALALVLALARRFRWAVVLAAALCVGEVFFFARTNLQHFQLEKMLAPPALRKLHHEAGDKRIIHSGFGTNMAMETGGYDAWGNESVVLRRYAEFVARSQSRSVETLDNILGYPPLGGGHLLRLVRLRYVTRGPLEDPMVSESSGPLPHFLFLHDYRIEPTPREIFERMGRPTFDPRRTVILEESPVPKPERGQGKGRVEILDRSTDHMDLAVELSAAAILLLTDSHAEGWRARPLGTSAQERYQLLRANYTLRAVPLAAGRHRLRVEYAPLAYRAGRWVSAVSALLFAGAVWFCVRRRGPGPARSAGTSAAASP